MKQGLLFALLYFVCIQLSPAQSSYMVTHYTRQEYGAGSQNWSVSADNNGFIYAANNEGLLVFDGAHWKIHRIPDQTIVRSVSVADDSMIYTGAYEDFGYWTEDPAHELHYCSLKPLLKNFKFHNNEIWKIISFKNKVYFQSFSALFVYDHKSVKPISIPSTLIFLLKVRDRLLVQSVRGNLYELINDSLISLNTPDALRGTEIRAIVPYLNGAVLIGTSSKGVFYYDGRNLQPWNVPANELLKKFQINNGIILGDKIIFGTIVQGIFILDFSGNILYHLHSENALQNNTVLSLCSDHNGGIWAGLDKGIDNISFNSPLEIYKEPGDHLGAVYTAALVGKTLYLGTNRGIFTYGWEVKGKRFSYQGIVNNSQGQVWDLKLVDGMLICGHTNGTYIIRDNGMEKISNVSGGYAIRRFYKDGIEYLIQSTYSALVVYRKSGNRWGYLLQVKGFIEPARFLEIDNLNNLWIGHAVKGLYKIQLSRKLDSVTSIVCFGKKDGLPSDFNIRVFKINNRVIFTTGTQFYTYDDLSSKIIPYTTLNKQLSGFEQATVVNDIGNDEYCLIRKNDIAVFGIRENNARLLFRFYLPLFKIDMVDGYENIVRIDDNRNLICLDDGFAIFNNKLFTPGSSKKPQLLFRDIYKINSQGDKIRITLNEKPFTLAHAWNNLAISFTYLNNEGASKRFQYKLEPVDPDWSSWTEAAEVNYNRLPKGDYTFLVRTISPTGEVTNPISLHFKVNPAIYSSTFAFILYIIMILGGIFISQFLFRRRLLRQHERLQVETEAKAILEKQQTEQEIIKLQNENLQSEIAHKNMQVADSTMAIIKKNELLIEIKNELEYQKKRLGNNLPSSYSERILTLINKNIADDNDWKVFEELFDQAHANFFKRLKASYPDLTQSDLKLCAYLKLNLSSKEIAPLLNISFRGVETRRYRLRKRLLLDSDENLVEFILQF